MTSATFPEVEFESINIHIFKIQSISFYILKYDYAKFPHRASSVNLVLRYISMDSVRFRLAVGKIQLLIDVDSLLARCDIVLMTATKRITFPNL